MTNLLVRSHLADLSVIEGGAMCAMMRIHDGQDPRWDRARLAASLCSVVGLLLSSKFPMFVVWGPELGLLYKDPYAEVLGAKHPHALGRRFHDTWSKIWSDIRLALARSGLTLVSC